MKSFSPEDFLPKQLARKLDIFMQFALVAAEEALASSKLKANPERIGIVLGTALGGISTVAETQEKITKTGKYRVSPHVVPKMLGNIAAAQIAIHHNLQGPQLDGKSACSSGASINKEWLRYS